MTLRDRQGTHVPVLLRETLQHLALSAGVSVLDGTTGAGGHSSQILKQIGPEGRLICLDRDPAMLQLAQQRVVGPNVFFQVGSYQLAETALATCEITAVDRLLLDLGYCSDQLLDDSRGFSFQSAGPLDLRFDASQGVSAAQLVAASTPEQLESIFQEWGEMPHSRKLSQSIAGKEFGSATEFAGAIARALGVVGDRHPATQAFQALRIAVNQEFSHLEQMLDHVLPRIVQPGGKVAIITFHSLEDRLVKQALKQQYWRPDPPKPICPSPSEVRYNPRSRSAKLRVAFRTEAPGPAAGQGGPDGSRNETGTADGRRTDRRV